MIATDLSAKRLREVLHYDADGGVFFWKLRRGRQRAGAIAGSLKPDGYIYTGVDGFDHKAHRLVFLYQTGQWPLHCVDHINGNRADNRWFNLRDVPFAVNCQNKRTAKPGKLYSNLIGVTRHKPSGLWVAAVKLNGKDRYRKYFRSEQEAHEAYLEAKRELHVGSTI